MAALPCRCLAVARKLPWPEAKIRLAGSASRKESRHPHTDSLLENDALGHFSRYFFFSLSLCFLERGGNEGKAGRREKERVGGCRGIWIFAWVFFKDARDS